MDSLHWNRTHPLRSSCDPYWYCGLSPICVESYLAGHVFGIQRVTSTRSTRLSSASCAKQSSEATKKQPSYGLSPGPTSHSQPRTKTWHITRQARQAYNRECGLLSKAQKAGVTTDQVTIHNQAKHATNTTVGCRHRGWSLTGQVSKKIDWGGCWEHASTPLKTSAGQGCELHRRPAGRNVRWCPSDGPLCPIARLNSPIPDLSCKLHQAAQSKEGIPTGQGNCTYSISRAGDAWRHSFLVNWLLLLAT